MSSPLGATNQTGYPTGTAPTVAVQAAAGTTATATLAAPSIDQRGTITVVSNGTGQAAGVIANVTFGKPVSQLGNPVVILQATTGPTEAANPYVTASTPTGFQVGVNNVLVAGTTYSFTYQTFP